MQPFDQDRWAAAYSRPGAPDATQLKPSGSSMSAAAYSAYDTDSALNLFRSLRGWNVKFIEAQPPEVFGKSVTHPERGTMQFRTLVETMAGHDLNHLRQIEALAA